MLQKEYRLRQTKDVRRVLSARQGIREGGLVLKYATSKQAVPRAGVVVGKKVSKKAVERNRIRRVVQEALRQEIKGIPQGVDIAIIVMPGFTGENSQHIHKRIHNLLKKASLGV